MPPRKKNSSAKKRVSAEQAMEADIRDAVRDIPKLIAEERGLRADRGADDLRQKRHILRAGVVILTLVVGGMWYWNTQAVFAGFAADGTESRILHNASDGIRGAIQTVAADDSAMRAAVEARKNARMTKTQEKIVDAIRAQLSTTMTTATSSSPDDTL
jgi:hypothetical protein